MRTRPIVLAFAFASATALVPMMLVASPPPPKPLQASVTPPPDATSTPLPQGIVSYSGQLIDFQQGFVFFSSGDGFSMAPNAQIVDAVTGGPTKLVPGPRVFARASFDPATKSVVQLALSTKRLSGGISLAEVKAFAQIASPIVPNPELAPKPGMQGRAGQGSLVPVTITVGVPQNTQLNADVYLTTDISGWNPRAIRMDRIDTNHYRIRTQFNRGAVVYYKVTRGDWNTAERTAVGLEGDPHKLDLTNNVDTQNIDFTVEHWADDNNNSGSAPGPNGIPTPYNPGALPFPVNQPGRQTAPPVRKP